MKFIGALLIPFLILAAGTTACAPGGTSVAKLAGITPLPSTTPTSPGSVGPVANGPWGGDHISMVVSDAGATLQFDCAHAVTDGALRASPDGFIRQTGKYTPEGGPTPASGFPGFEASYYGTVDGSAMQMTVSYTDAAGAVHSTLYQLTEGSSGGLTRCQ